MGRLDSEERTAVAALLKKGHSPSAVARLLGGHGRSSSISSASPGDRICRCTDCAVGQGHHLAQLVPPDGLPDFQRLTLTHVCDDSYVGRLTTNEMAGS